DERGLCPQRAVVHHRDRHADVAARQTRPDRAHQAHARRAAGRPLVRSPHSSLVALIVLAAATTFLGFAILTFLPIFAKQIFHEGADTFSHLMAFSGAG